MKLNSAQIANVTILAGLLSAIPDDQYDHSELFGPGPACAAGHAARNANRGQFKRGVANPDRSFIDRLLRRNGMNLVPYEVRDESIARFTANAFGEGLWPSVFHASAFGIPASQVTRTMVIKRLKRIAAKGKTPA